MSRTSILVSNTGTKPVGAEDVGGAGTELRETIQLGGLAAAELADVKNAAPTTALYGLVTRPLLYGADGNPLNAPADGAVDSGGSLKVGAKVLLQSAALPTAESTGDRIPLMADEYGRLRIVTERRKLLGGYKFDAGRLTILASAHGSTAGFLWLVNPVGSTVIARLKKWMATSVPTAASAFVTSPRVTIELMTFVGTGTGATITPAKRDSTDATPTCKVFTASTSLTITAGAAIGDFTVPAVLTAVGIAVPVDQYLYDATDDDDYMVLRAGQGIVLRQADAGSTSDTRLLTSYASWEEY